MIPGREVLDDALAELGERYADEVPRPEYWGGYLLRPTAIEFWEGRANRLHDRTHYLREGEAAGAASGSARSAAEQHRADDRHDDREHGEAPAEDAEDREHGADHRDEPGRAADLHQPVGALLARAARRLATRRAARGRSRVGLRAGGDLAQVERLVERLLVDAVLARDLAQRAAALPTRP